MIYLGVDPDLHRTGIALLTADLSICTVVCCKAKGTTGGEAVVDMLNAINTAMGAIYADLNVPPLAVVVEGQEVTYASRSKGANPQSIVLLAQVAGGAVALAMVRWATEAVFHMPKPAEWKGSVPKEIHQARVMSKLGWSHERRSGYCVPLGFGTMNVYGADRLNVGDWEHVADAVGLALWARNQHVRSETIRKAG
jgi:Holliday junction resolvasome RuvABC endonuclease subunit